MSAGETLWRAFPEDQLLWVAGGDGLEDGALAVAGECRISCWQVLCLEQFEIAANLKLELPFFANELLGAVHLHGPLGLETIMDFCNHLRSILEKAEEQKRVPQLLAETRSSGKFAATAGRILDPPEGLHC